MSDAKPEVTRDQCDRCDWLAVLGSAERATCSAFFDALSAARKTAEKDGRAEDAAVFALLESVCGICLHPDDPSGPFRPLCETQTRRSYLPEDYGETELDVFEHLTTRAKEPEFLARLADILWYRRRDHTKASLAVDSYLASAKLLMTDDPVGGTVRLRRAAQIACELGRKHPSYDKVGQELASAVSALEAKNEPRLLIGLLRILADYRMRDDLDRYAEMAERLADKPSNPDACDSSIMLIGLAQGLWAAAKQPEKAEVCPLRIAQLCEAKVEMLRAAGAEAIILAHETARAVEAYRRAGKQKEKVEQLLLSLKEHQKAASAAMRSIGSSIDLTDVAQEAQSLLAGKKAAQAVVALAREFRPQNRAKVRQAVIEGRKKHVLWSILPKTAVDSATGNVLAKIPYALSKESGEAELALNAEIIGDASHTQQLFGAAFVEAARQIIMKEDPGELDSFLGQFLVLNPFVPVGRELLFLRGLRAGFEGDWPVCLHLLIPQIENSMRVLLAQAGCRTTTHDSQGIEKEIDLNVILKGDLVQDAEAVFGEDLIFELRVLLVEPLGHNLRNKVSHGLLDYDRIMQPEALFLFWVVLHLCYVGFLFVRQKMESISAPSPEAKPQEAASGETQEPAPPPQA